MDKKDFVEKWGYKGGRLTFDCREDLEKDLEELIGKPICNICNDYLDDDTKLLYTKEDIQELLKKQRENCANKLIAEDICDHKCDELYLRIVNTPSPSLDDK